MDFLVQTHETIRDSSIVHQKKYIRLQAGKRGLVEAIFKFDVHELRVFMTMLAMVKPEDEVFHLYKVRVSDIIKLFQLNTGGKMYAEIRAAAHRLQGRVFVFPSKIDDDEVDTYIPVLTEVSTLRNNPDPEYIYLQFHHKLKPYLLQLRSEYLTLELRYVINLTSYYSIRLYMMLKHRFRQNTLTPTYTIAELREKLNIADDMYPRYSVFKQQILNRALKDIGKQTDLLVEIVDEIKQKRAVHAIKFLLTPKVMILTGEPKAVKSTVKTLQEEDDELANRALKLGFTAEVLGICRDVYSEELIQNAVDYVESELASGKKLDNPAGFLRQTLKNPDWMAAFIKKRDSTQQQQKARQQAKEAAKRQQQQVKVQEDEAAQQYLQLVEKGRVLAQAQPEVFQDWLMTTRNVSAGKVKSLLFKGFTVEALLGTDDINLCSSLYSYYLDQGTDI